MTDTIRGRWPAPVASEQTLRAERELGIDGKPYYFFVLRANENFGRVVFVLEEKEADWPSDAKGATPFDSGGLWSGAIVTHPALDGDDGRRMFFRSNDVRLVDWRREFQKHVNTRYEALAYYLEGRPPEPEARQPHRAAVVDGDDKRAWTWEVRVPYGLIADRLVPRAAYMTQADYSRYLHWVRRPPPSLTESESLRIQQWVKDHVSLTKDVVQTVEDWLTQDGSDV